MLKYIYGNKMNIVFVIILSLLGAGGKILLSFSMGLFTNAATNLVFSKLIAFGLLSLFSLLLIFVLDIGETFVRGEYSKKCILDIKKDYYDGIMFSTYESYNEKDGNYYINMVTNGLNTIKSDYFDNIALSIGYGIVSVVGFIALITINFKLAILISTIAIIPLITNPLLHKKIGYKKNEMIKASEKTFKGATEFFSGSKIIRDFNSEVIFSEKINAIEKDNEQKKFENDFYDNRILLLSRFIGMSSQIGCMLVAAYFVVRGEIQIGGMISCTQLVNYVFPSINMLNAKRLIIKSTKPIREQILNVILLPEDKKTTHFNNGKIEFKNYSLSFNDQRVIDRFNYCINQNSKVGIIGRSGGGKSSLINSFLGNLKNFNGNILLDNINISNINEKDFNRNVAYCPQHPFIFNESLVNNITMFAKVDDVKLNRIICGLKLDGISKDIILDPKKISGGEAKRIGIARALMKDASIYVFDEPTSGLDPNTGEMVTDMIMKEETVTTIVVTHNQSSSHLSRFDEIIDVNNL